MPEPWVMAQHRTMARWISSKVAAPVTDVTKDLSDGLVLIQLINTILHETQLSPYRLNPVYKKPTFRLQKLENADDVLKFCSLVLQINTCNISAENIVNGDLKLVLGFIWTLFVYASSRLISLSNEGRSVLEIKTILLAWLNDLGRRKALPQVCNFNKDWSVQQEKRPDLIFAAILDFYFPNFVSYSAFVEGKRLTNLHTVITRAEQELDIPQLAQPEDFNVLVPEEKCIIFYLLQWYVTLEVNADVDVDAGEEKEAAQQATLGTFVRLVLAAVKAKNRYDTKSLRLLNCLNDNIAKLGDLRHDTETHIVPVDLAGEIDTYCATINPAEPLAAALAGRSNFFRIEQTFHALRHRMTVYEQFRFKTKPALFHHDMPELQSLAKAVQAELKEAGIAGYQPLKLLTLGLLASRLDALNDADKKLCRVLDAELERVWALRLQHLDALVATLEQRLRGEASVPECARTFVAHLDILQNIKSEIGEYRERLKQVHTTADLRVMLDTLDTLTTPATPETPCELPFALFQEHTSAQKNRSNLTFSDVKRFFRSALGSSAVLPRELHEFVQLIPTRRLLNRSESDDFSRSYALDDSDDETIFDVLRTLEHKLLGNKLYDLGLMVTKMENGFKI